MAEFEARPWGSWEVLDEASGYKVKRITVLPHRRLSYQTHERRAEHWVVVSGKATCVLEGQAGYAGPGDCLEVPVGAAHRIVNEQDEQLVIIEVQRGEYTGEDDILRLEDDYGRCASLQ
jgi:mannose-6-phosphate isomerase